MRAASASDFEEARAALSDLLALLPGLRVVVLLGRKAAQAWRAADVGNNYAVIEAPHPSPKVLNTRKGARRDIIDALLEAKRVAGIA